MAAPQSKIESHVALLHGWIRECDREHGDECQAAPIAGRPQHHIPDWVIDTENGCIVPGDSVPRYVALSYVWSSPANDHIGEEATAEDRLMLQQGNLADFCCPGFLDSAIFARVPLVIQDAIDFVKHSGFRYLWVDSLCIVQHDETTKERVGLMNEIYSGASFTIIAAASATGLYGNKHPDVKHLPPGIESIQYLHSKLLCSHWASRGWTFQEQLLSKRSIIFLDDICFWDCQYTVYWPTRDEDRHSSRDDDTSSHVWLRLSSNQHPLEKRAYNRVRRMIEGDLLRGEVSYDLNFLSPVPDFKFYIELACRYSNRNLTYDQDVLPAFAGVLEALSRCSFRGGFISGLPALFLDSALLWQPLVKARRRSPVGRATKIAPMTPLPSWSWAGWQCLIDPGSLEAGLDYLPEDLRPGNSWATRKLVEWSTISDGRSVNPIDEPALLHSFQAAQKESNTNPLPTGWSRLGPSRFVHAGNGEDFYEYPLPTQNIRYPTMADRNISLLSCTTKKASLRVRRVLVPYEIYTKTMSKARSTQISVFDTALYDFKPELQALCPIVTLEDEKRRWAGAMRIMEDRAGVRSGSKLEMIAISTGDAFYGDAKRSYPEWIDSHGRWSWGRKYGGIQYGDYLFRPLDWHDDQDGGGGVSNFSAEVDTRKSLDAGIDVGPFARLFAFPYLESAETIFGGNTYQFYNVLWVETIDGVMYRKAAGRVRKEIWELNCGEDTEVVLG